MALSVVSQRRLPPHGWDELSVQLFLHELAAMDSNNFVGESLGGGCFVFAGQQSKSTRLLDSACLRVCVVVVVVVVIGVLQRMWG